MLCPYWATPASYIDLNAKQDQKIKIGFLSIVQYGKGD